MADSQCKNRMQIKYPLHKLKNDQKPSWYLIEIIRGKLFTRPNIWNWEPLSAYFSDQLEILSSQEMLEADNQ